MAVIIPREKCIGCGMCAAACAFGAAVMSSDGRVTLHPDKCTECGKCVCRCVLRIIELPEQAEEQPAGEAEDPAGKD